MPEFNMVDPSFKKFSEGLEITIQISLIGFSYCISTAPDKMIRVFRSYKFSDAVMLEDILNETQSILHKDDFLKLPFNKVKAIFVNRKSTIVPNEFYKPELIKRILEFNQPIDDLDELHFNSIQQINSKLIFTFPTYLAGMLIDCFKKVEFYNQAFPLIQLANDFPAGETDYKIAVNLNKEFFDMVVIKNNHLQLSNNFLYVNSTDLLYFILFVCKQLGINQNTAVFYFTGELSSKSELIHGLSGYLKNIQHIESISGVVFSIDMNPAVLSRFPTIFKLALCE
jgi:hypothetical protein